MSTQEKEKVLTSESTKKTDVDLVDNDASYESEEVSNDNTSESNESGSEHELSDKEEDKVTDTKVTETKVKVKSEKKVKAAVSSKKKSRKSKKSKESTESEVQEERPTLKKLGFEEIQVNLRFIGDLKEDEKLVVNEPYIEVDQRYLQSVRRWFYGDSRTATIDYIDHIVNETKVLTHDIVGNIEKGVDKKTNMERLVKIQSLLLSALTGLDKLLITYDDDKLNKARIGMIKDKVNAFCDQDLKKSVSHYTN